MKSHDWIAVIAALGWLAWASAGSPAWAQTPTESTLDANFPSFAVYRHYCAACHGVLADGNGPVAGALATEPPDLTRLSEKYGSPLRTDELSEWIDGRSMALSHGTREMPVWGERLYESKRDSQQLENVRRGTILRIIEYLDAIQVRPSDGE